MKHSSAWRFLRWAPLPVMACLLAGCSGGGVGGGGFGGGGTVATVNGTAISRDELRSFLEATAGEQALSQLITRQIVLQNLKKLNLTVSDAELNGLLEERKQDPQVAEAISKSGENSPRVEELKNQLRVQLAIDKIATNDIKVDDKALQAWFQKSRKRYDQPARVKLGILLSSTKVRADIMEGQLKNKSKTFLELVNEQKKASDPAANSSRAETGDNGSGAAYLPVDSMPPAVKDAINKLKPNDVSPVLVMGGRGPATTYAIVRLIDRQEAKPASAQDPVVVDDYKLEQLARKTAPEAAPQLGLKGKPTFDKIEQQVGGMLMQQNFQAGRFQQPTWRDVMHFIVRGSEQRTLQDLQKDVKVESSDPTYSRVVDSFKPAPAPTMPPGAAPGPPVPPAPGRAPAPSAPAK